MHVLNKLINGHSAQILTTLGTHWGTAIAEVVHPNTLVGYWRKKRGCNVEVKHGRYEKLLEKVPHTALG